jgi:hypothetical protein
MRKDLTAKDAKSARKAIEKWSSALSFSFPFYLGALGVLGG